MICTDKNCKGYGKEFVDRGYNYPVCSATPQKEETIEQYLNRIGAKNNPEKHEEFSRFDRDN